MKKENTVVNQKTGAWYEVDPKNLRLETNAYRLYVCKDSAGKARIAKVAKSSANNTVLEREALLLNVLKQEVAELDRENGKRSGIDIMFPEVVDCFYLSPNDVSRRRAITILSFDRALEDKDGAITESTETLIPLSKLPESKYVVDPKSVAWIVGKQLLLMAFCQRRDIRVVNFHPTNVFIQAERHHVIIYDWTTAFYGEEVNEGHTMVEAIQIALSAITVLGGNVEEGTIPQHEQTSGESEGRFAKFLLDMLHGTGAGAKSAIALHKSWYEDVVWYTWKRGFHEMQVKQIV